MIRFELPFALPTLNPMLREGRWKRKSARNSLAWSVVAAIGNQRPKTPFARAHVRVERHSTGNPDPDNLLAKGLLDVLQPPSARQPAGLGIITDDSAHGIRLEIIAVRVRHRAEQKTVVTIKEFP